MQHIGKRFVEVIANGITGIKNLFRRISCQKNIRKDKDVENIIAEAVKAYPIVFSGLYESMYMVASGRLGGKLGTFDEWCIRSSNIKDGTIFSELFISRFSGFRDWGDTEYIENAQLILRGISKAGVIRDAYKEIVADGETYLRYGALDGRALDYGEIVQILMPCWYKDELILEKGILK